MKLFKIGSNGNWLFINLEGVKEISKHIGKGGTLKGKM